MAAQKRQRNVALPARAVWDVAVNSIANNADLCAAVLDRQDFDSTHDWIAVGRDMRIAMKKAEQEHHIADTKSEDEELVEA